MNCKWDLHDIKINCFELQPIISEIYMNIKLTVKLWKWKNGNVKGRCKKEKEKSFPLPISSLKQTRKVGMSFLFLIFLQLSLCTFICMTGRTTLYLQLRTWFLQVLPAPIFELSFLMS